MPSERDARPYLSRVRLLLQRYLLIHYPWHDLAEGRAHPERGGNYLLQYFRGEHVSEHRAEAFAQMSAALDSAPERADEPSALVRRYRELEAQFRLDGTASDLLWLLLAPWLEPDIYWVYRLVEANRGARGVDEELLWHVLDPRGEDSGPVRAALAPDGPLLRGALVELLEPRRGDPARTFVAARRLVEHLLGQPLAGAALPGFASLPVEAPDERRVEAQRAEEDQPETLELLRAVLRKRRAPLVVTRDRATALRLLTAVAEPLSQRLVLLRLDPATATAFPPAVPGLARDAVFENLLPVVELPSDARLDPVVLRALRELFDRVGTLALLTEDTPPGVALAELTRHVPLTRVSVALPDAERRAVQWTTRLRGLSLEGDPGEAVARLRVYPLGPGQMDAAVRLVASAPEASASRRRPVRIGDLEAACQALTEGSLGMLAQRVHVTARWDDLVLPETIREKIEEIRSFARHYTRVAEAWGLDRTVAYGRALTVLFSGASGTGKTMTAGLLARDLGIEVYRIDLSRIVSKYIGETEKHLDRLFELARTSQLALLFDEADAVFGKRTDIKSSTDRYANLETNYLLQKMEEFDGVVFLTTNFRQSLDEAFLRRLRYKLDFPSPDERTRTLLWRKMVSSGIPQDEAIAFDALAHEFDFTGGQIRNVVVRGALAAAEAGTGLTQALLRQAAIAECRELGRVVRA